MIGRQCHVCKGFGGVTEGSHDYGYTSIECPICEGSGWLTIGQSIAYYWWLMAYKLNCTYDNLYWRVKLKWRAWRQP